MTNEIFVDWLIEIFVEMTDSRIPLLMYEYMGLIVNLVTVMCVHYSYMLSL